MRIRASLGFRRTMVVRFQEGASTIPRHPAPRRRLFSAQAIAAIIACLAMVVVTASFVLNETAISETRRIGSVGRVLVLDPVIIEALQQAQGQQAPGEQAQGQQAQGQQAQGQQALEDHLWDLAGASGLSALAVSLPDGTILGWAGADIPGLEDRIAASELDTSILDEQVQDRVEAEDDSGMRERLLPVVAADGTVIGVVVVATERWVITAIGGPILPLVLLQYGVALALVFLFAGAVGRWMHGISYSYTRYEVDEMLREREALLNGMDDGVIAVDADDVITLVNPAATRLTGVTTAAVSQPAAEALDGALLAVLDTADGAERLVLVDELVLVVRVDDARRDDDEGGRLLVLRDRSELAAVLEDLDGVESVADALRSKSHEFANTLHRLSGLIELGRYDDAAALIQRSAGGGDHAIGPAEESLHDFQLVSLLTSWRARASELGMTLDVDPTSTLPDGADALPIRMSDDICTVVGNLVRNAVEACTAGDRIRVLIEQRGSEDDRSIVIRVDDDGPGIPVVDRERVFEQGFSSKLTSDDPTEFRGTGLALVSRIAARYEGTSEVVDGAGPGTSIHVVLTRTAQAPDPKKSEPAATRTS